MRSEASITFGNKQAFPDQSFTGMTVRTWLVGQALARPGAASVEYEHLPRMGPQEAAKHAVDLADAVLEELAK